ncbi:MAG: GNAT family N-acetyltransferase [Actinobacteria bacterium]|nr:GNAT family N-acetyltransferase [Actinomycetota bacterium]
MAAVTRHRYVVDLDVLTGADPILEDPVILRAPHLDDLEALSTLMLEAYAGTIDYDDETIDDARREVSQYLTGSPLLDMSRVAHLDGSMVGAVLVSEWGGEPLIGYVMTRPEHKNKGLATLMLRTCLRVLSESGSSKAHAFIAEGNVPSEALFLGVGARRVE